MLEKLIGTNLTQGTNRLLGKITLKDISDENFGQRIADNGNSLQWIMGHLISSRIYMLNLLGAELDQYCDGKFARGMIAEDAESYPTKSEMLKTWDEIARKLESVMENIDESVLSKEIGTGFPIKDDTIYGGVVFLTLHESYHLGQMAYVRSFLGYKSMTG